MSAEVFVHPAWLEKRPANDVAYHFQLRGYDLIVGPRFLKVEPKPPYKEGEKRDGPGH
jgi:hypothetical protein